MTSLSPIIPRAAVVGGRPNDTHWLVEFHSTNRDTVLDSYPRVFVPAPSRNAAHLIAAVYNGELNEEVIIEALSHTREHRQRLKGRNEAGRKCPPFVWR